MGKYCHFGWIKIDQTGHLVYY